MAQTIPEEQTKPYHIYADETCQTKHRWMALGVTIVAEEHADHVCDCLLVLTIPHQRPVSDATLSNAKRGRPFIPVAAGL